MKKKELDSSANESEVSFSVSKNLKTIRSDRGLSLEKLAQISGVSRTMLNQIELCKSTPSINILWKIARALDVPFSFLINSTEKESSVVLKQNEMKILTSRDGKFSSKALFPFEADHPHTYHNPGAISSIMYLVMTYTKRSE